MAIPQAPAELKHICNQWSEDLQGFNAAADRMAYIESALPKLLHNRALFIDILSHAAEGRSYPNIRRATLFRDEFLLYLDPSNRFSLRMYIYTPNRYTPVHDHNSWGVYANITGQLEVIRYRREDDGKRKGFAVLRETARIRMHPGDTECVLPLNGGIHQTGNAAGQTTVMVNVYGRPLRRLHINTFDIKTGRITPRYPPRIHKKRLAKQALNALK